jgi:hypothetical protein
LLHGLSSTITLPQTSNTTANQSRLFVIQRDQLFLFLTHKPSSSSIATTSSLTSSPHHSITSTLPIDSSATRPTQQDMISFPNHGDSSNTESSQHGDTTLPHQNSSLDSHNKTLSSQKMHTKRGAVLSTFVLRLFHSLLDLPTRLEHWWINIENVLFMLCSSSTIQESFSSSVFLSFPIGLLFVLSLFTSWFFGWFRSSFASWTPFVPLSRAHFVSFLIALLVFDQCLEVSLRLGSLHFDNV